MVDQRTHVAPAAATVSTIMTRTVYCVQPDVGVDLLARLFLKYAVSGLPVVDERGRPRDWGWQCVTRLASLNISTTR